MSLRILLTSPWWRQPAYTALSYSTLAKDCLELKASEKPQEKLSAPSLICLKITHNPLPWHGLYHWKWGVGAMLCLHKQTSQNSLYLPLVSHICSTVCHLYTLSPPPLSLFTHFSTIYHLLLKWYITPQLTYFFGFFSFEPSIQVELKNISKICTSFLLLICIGIFWSASPFLDFSQD